MFEMMVNTPDPHQVSAVCNDLAVQISTVHITSLCCVGGCYTYRNDPINTITTNSDGQMMNGWNQCRNPRWNREARYR